MSVYIMDVLCLGFIVVCVCVCVCVCVRERERGRELSKKLAFIVLFIGIC